MKRCALYRRVSEKTDTNVAGSMEDQRTICAAFVAQIGTVVADYEEIGVSAYHEKSLKARPAYQQLLADAKAGLFDTVVVYKFDRFSRRMLIALQARAELDAAGVEVISATERFDTTTAAGRFGVRNMLSVAELYSDMLSERLKLARASEARRGRHTGPIPVGYTTAPEGHGALMAHPPYDALVSLACPLYAPGQHSAVRVARALNDAGYTMPNGRPLTDQDVRRIMQNAMVYAGYVRSEDIWIPGQYHPQLISKELCDRVLATFNRRSTAQGRRFVRTQEPDTMLAGLMYCERCRQNDRESKMHFLADKRKSPPLRRYRCKTHADGGDCDAPYALAEPTEAQMLSICDRLALPAPWVDEAIAIAAQILHTPPTAAPTNDPARIQEKIRRLGQRYNDLLIGDEEYRAELAALRAQLDTAPSLPRQQPRARLEEVAERLRDLPHLIRDGTMPERRAALGEVFDQLYAERGRIIAIRPTGLYESLLLAARESVIAIGLISATLHKLHFTAILILTPRPAGCAGGEQVRS